jgi:hypothetical protein
MAWLQTPLGTGIDHYYLFASLRERYRKLHYSFIRFESLRRGTGRATPPRTAVRGRASARRPARHLYFPSFTYNFCRPRVGWTLNVTRPATTAAAGSKEDDLITQLMGMGFAAEQARDALSSKVRIIVCKEQI